MSADLLRTAAQTLREKAGAARRDMPARWEPKALSDGRAWVMAEDDGFSMHGYPSGAEFIALADPAFALEVAMLLTRAADHADGISKTCGSCQKQALAVARAVLRRES